MSVECRYAYLVAHFTLVDGVPYYERSGIYSADAASLTRLNGEIVMDVFKTHARTFEKARDRVKEARDELFPWAKRRRP